MKKIVILSLVQLFIVNIAFAEESWFEYGEQGGMTFSIDKSSIIKADNNAITSWTLLKMKDKDNGKSGSPYALKNKLSADCGKKKLKAVETVTIDTSGKVFSKNAVNNELDTTPGTPNATVLSIMCQPAQN
ncbi:MAG: surface-adhesin E family protein [Desulfuromonadaceae bacterium]